MCYRQTGQIDVFEMDLVSLDEEIGEDSLTEEISKTLFCSIVSTQESQTPPDVLAQQVDDALEPRYKTVARNPPQSFLKQISNWTLRKILDANTPQSDDKERD